MARSRDHTEPEVVESPPSSAPFSTAVADKPPMDKDAHIALLLARLAEMEAQHKAAGVEARPAKQGVYRVALSEAPCFRPKAHVEAKPSRFLTDDHKKMLASLGTKAQGVYDALELHQSNPKQGVDVTARERFIKENNLGDLDVSQFRVRFEQGQPVGHLDIAAASPWEAEAIFKSFNGITATTAAFTTFLVDEEVKEGEVKEDPKAKRR